MTDFEFSVLDVAFKDTCFGLTDTDDIKQFLFAGTTVLGFLNGLLETVSYKTGGRELSEVEQRM